MNYYEHYMGDYAKKTAKLKLVDHGSYRLLLDEYYSNEAPLPAPYADLYHICRAVSKPEQDSVRKVADLFFPVAPDGLRHNDRADAELAKAIPRILASRVNGKKGGRRSISNNPPGNPAGIPTGNPVGIPAGTPPATRQPPQQAPQPGEALPHAPHAIPIGEEQRGVTVTPSWPHGLSPDTWRDWKSHLVAKGKGVTPQQERWQLAKLLEHADPEGVVRRAIEGGHRNLEPVGGYADSNAKAALAVRRVGTIDNIINGTDPNERHERTIEGEPAERVDREADEALPLDLREQGGDRLRHSR